MAKPFLRMILKLESGVRQIPDPPPPNGPNGFRIKIRSEARFSFRSKGVELERASARTQRPGLKIGLALNKANTVNYLGLNPSQFDVSLMVS